MNGKRDSLLIVDDERIVADTTALIFRQHGYEAKVAYSAEQAVELIHGWHPSLAIVDVILPQMDGIMLARLVQRMCPDCRVVLFSSQSVAGPGLAAALKEFPLLTKPIPPEELLAFVNEELQPN